MSKPTLRFSDLARSAAVLMGSQWAFVTAVLVVATWAVSGPYFGYSDTWQLVINTGTTIVTFLMVFVIQNTQNRDSRALHLKLDELLKAVDRARIQLINLEDCPDEEIEALERQFKAVRRHTAKTMAAKSALEQDTIGISEGVAS